MDFDSDTKLQIFEKLAQGGMAEVFRGRIVGAGDFKKTIAIKRMLPEFAEDENFKEMLMRETQLSAILTHPNIVQVFSTANLEGNLYLLMEFVDGKTLDEVINFTDEIGVTIPLDVCCFMIAEAARGLFYAHDLKSEETGESLKLVHRDISPHNMMISYAGDVKIMDFGIAKAATSTDLTQAGVVKGKEAYLSPEQVVGKPADARSDLFALGIVFYEVVTGRYLFDEETTLETLQTIKKCHIPEILHKGKPIDPELEKIMRKALAKDREVRFQSAEDFANALTVYKNKKYPAFTRSSMSGFMGLLFKEVIENEHDKRREGNTQVLETISLTSGAGNQTIGTDSFNPPPIDYDAFLELEQRTKANLQALKEDGGRKERKKSKPTTWKSRLGMSVLHLIIFTAIAGLFGIGVNFGFEKVSGVGMQEFWISMQSYQESFAPETLTVKKVLTNLIFFGIALIALASMPAIILGAALGSRRKVLDIFFSAASFLAAVFIGLLCYNFFVALRAADATAIWLPLGLIATVNEIIQIALLSPIVNVMQLVVDEVPLKEFLKTFLTEDGAINTQVAMQSIGKCFGFKVITEHMVGLLTAAYIFILGSSIASHFDFKKNKRRVMQLLFVAAIYLTTLSLVGMVDIKSTAEEVDLQLLTVSLPQGVMTFALMNWIFIFLLTFLINIFVGTHEED